MDNFEKEMRLSVKRGANRAIATEMKPGTVNVYRCYPGCGLLFTVYESRIYGGCRRCGNRKMNESYPYGLFEWIRMFWWNLTKSWQIHGPEGRGWTVKELKAAQIRAALDRRVGG